MSRYSKSLTLFKNLPVQYKLSIPIVCLSVISLLLVISTWNLLISTSTFGIFIPLLALVNILFILILWLLIKNQLIKPLNKLADITSLVADGDLDTEINIQSEDEMGQIASSTKSLAESIKKARLFAKNIGEGNYETDVLNGSVREIHKDTLYASLLSMRDQLKNVAETDAQRNWVTKGMAEFTEILRSNDTDLKQLGNKIITGLVRYLQAGQGALFVHNNDNPDKPCLELTACYAYNESLFQEKKIILEKDYGEGLVGQAFLENETIYMSNLPEGYLNIASGLGNSNPRSLLIVPLELNGTTEGIIELASLKIFEKHQIEFVERLAENIASAILSIKVNEHTKKLLKESQQLTQKLQVQEEEMRQNYEELQTTQEQMMITQTELDGQLNAINNSTIAKVEFNLDGKIVSANQSFCNLVKYDIEELKHQTYSDFAADNFADNQMYDEFWRNLRKGIAQSGEYKIKSKDKQEFWINAIYSPVIDKKGETYKVIQLAFDITEAKNLLVETQTQAAILQAQESELRQSMTELKNTQNELNKKSQAIIELKEQEALNERMKAKEIESKNQLITSSIQYAQNIQRAILPSEDKIKETVADMFVVYLPKDIVSGDFYWFSHIENKSFFAAVDCTGHGVPGAFMSIIGNTILNEIVNVQQVYDPALILELLHIGVRSKLRQAESSNYDGMDISICVLENKNGKQYELTFSGAKRPLFYYNHQDKDLLELKGDRKSIGGWQKEEHRTFGKEQITLKKGDLVYLLTDGLIDNPDAKRKKFGMKRFKEIILNNIDEPLQKQKQLILKAVELHQKGTEQRDDITVLGLKI